MSEELCLARAASFGGGWADMSHRACSLPKGHEGQHIAYWEHRVTGNGRNVCWLGPWEDERPYKGPLTDRLQDEWNNRFDGDDA